VTFSPLSHTLTVVGDADANDLRVQPEAPDPAGFTTQFLLASDSDTFNGRAGPFLTPVGVRNIAIRLLGGDDTVYFDITTMTIHLAGNLSIYGGDGANRVSTAWAIPTPPTDLKVDGTVSITNGTTAAGQAQTHLINLSVGGNVTVRNGSANSLTAINRVLAADSNIGGDLAVIDGMGGGSLYLEDTNVGGNVTFSNGPGGTFSPTTAIGVNKNLGRRSVIRESVTVTDVGGNGNDYLDDAEVWGNVTFNDGSVGFGTIFDALDTSAPVLVRGNLTITGTGNNEVDVGSPAAIGFGRGLGLMVGHNFTVATGDGDDVLHLNRLQVGGATRLALGDGNNTVTIDDSVFAGPFSLTAGTGADKVSVETATGTSVPTEFGGPVTMSLGSGDDSLALGGAFDAGQMVIVEDSFRVHRGAGNDTLTEPPGHQDFPFGTSVQWVV
jgi:hypothetical protein